MGIITLTSDYGVVDHRAAAIKGNILSLDPTAVIVDITHKVQQYNLKQTAYTVRNAYHHFPRNTVHIISVDSFYRKDRPYLIFYADNHYFLCADNGIFSLIFPDLLPESVHEITVNNRFDDKVGFASAEILVPAAVHLQNGGIPAVIGRQITSYKTLVLPNAVFNPANSVIVGEAIYIDNFGNIISNIPRKVFEENAAKFGSFEIKFRRFTLSKIFDHYTDIVVDWDNESLYHGKAAAVFGENNLMEITIYKGSLKNGANSLMDIGIGEKIYVEFKKEIPETSKI